MLKVILKKLHFISDFAFYFFVRVRHDLTALDQRLVHQQEKNINTPSPDERAKSLGEMLKITYH